MASGTRLVKDSATRRMGSRPFVKRTASGAHPLLQSPWEGRCPCVRSLKRTRSALQLERTHLQETACPRLGKGATGMVASRPAPSARQIQISRLRCIRISRQLHQGSKAALALLSALRSALRSALHSAAAAATIGCTGRRCVGRSSFACRSAPLDLRLPDPQAARRPHPSALARCERSCSPQRHARPTHPAPSPRGGGIAGGLAAFFAPAGRVTRRSRPHARRATRPR